MQLYYVYTWLYQYAQSIHLLGYQYWSPLARNQSCSYQDIYLFALLSEQVHLSCYKLWGHFLCVPSRSLTTFLKVKYRSEFLNIPTISRDQVIFNSVKAIEILVKFRNLKIFGWQGYRNSSVSSKIWTFSVRSSEISLGMVKI